MVMRERALFVLASQTKAARLARLEHWGVRVVMHKATRFLLASRPIPAVAGFWLWLLVVRKAAVFFLALGSIAALLWRAILLSLRVDGRVMWGGGGGGWLGR